MNNAIHALLDEYRDEIADGVARNGASRHERPVYHGRAIDERNASTARVADWWARLEAAVGQPLGPDAPEAIWRPIAEVLYDINSVAAAEQRIDENWQAICDGQYAS